MFLHEYLQNLGLNEKEAKVYLASLEIGPGLVAQIAAKAGIKRTTVHEILKALQVQNLISITAKGRRKAYVATDPVNLQRIIEQKEKMLKTILPELSALSQTGNKRPKIQVYEGENGIIALYDDIIREKKDVYAFLGVQEIKEPLVTHLDDVFVPQRWKNNIHAYVIAPDTDESRSYHVKDKEQLRTTKLLSQEEYPFSVAINIYANKVSFVSHPKKEMFGVIISSPEIAKTMKLIFDFFWKRL